MAATMMTILPARTQALAITGHRKPDQDNRRKSSSSSSSSNWWSPLFGLSAEPDYIDSVHEKIDLSVQSGGRKPDENQDLKPVPRSRLVPAGLLTEEKAKQLRKMTREAEAFHDVMYHSAVASRLALDFSDRRSGR